MYACMYVCKYAYTSREACLQRASLLWHSIDSALLAVLLQLELQTSVFSFASVNHYPTYALRHGSVFFLRKTKMAMKGGRFVNFFATGSLAVAYLCKSMPLGLSTADAQGAWEVWWQFSNRCVRRLQTTVLKSS